MFWLCVTESLFRCLFVPPYVCASAGAGEGLGQARGADEPRHWTASSPQPKGAWQLVLVASSFFWEGHHQFRVPVALRDQSLLRITSNIGEMGLGVHLALSSYLLLLWPLPQPTSPACCWVDLCGLAFMAV